MNSSDISNPPPLPFAALSNKRNLTSTSDANLFKEQVKRRKCSTKKDRPNQLTCKNIRQDDYGVLGTSIGGICSRIPGSTSPPSEATSESGALPSPTSVARSAATITRAPSTCQIVGVAPENVSPEVRASVVGYMSRIAAEITRRTRETPLPSDPAQLQQFLSSIMTSLTAN